jgi:hypothetical protein
MLFIAILTACEWPFTTFLMSPAAENRFFGTLYYGFTAQANGFECLHRLFFPQHGIALFLGLARASFCACTQLGSAFSSAAGCARSSVRNRATLEVR